MTLAGLNDILSNAQDPEWFNKVQTHLNFPSVNYSHTYIGLPALYKFISDQEAGWSALEEITTSNFSNSVEFFAHLKSTIIQHVNPLIDSTDANRDSMWQNTILQKTYTRKENIFLFNSPEVLFLMNVKRDYPASYDGAYNFIIGSVNGNSVSTKNNLIGSILAYEFTLKNISQITERRNAEKQSISSLRNNFGKYISENETFLSEFKKDLSQRIITHNTDIDNLKEKKSQEFDEIKVDKSNAFEDWFNKSNSDYTAFYTDSQLKIGELETTYKAKLKLEEPAKYWSDRAVELKKQAWWAMIILIGLTIFASIFLGIVLWNSPDSILASWFNNDKSAAIRWSLVFIALLSLIAYGIRAVSKVMFSSFHLARDCEERYTLTYFYLALMKDSNVDPKDSNLIMQSLFSRSDTGLLKEDSSPTMPGAGGIIGNFVGKPN